MTDSNEQVASEISIRIKSLEELNGESLKNEMQELKKALLENPQACLLLLPEDVGLMVSYLRKLTGTALASASSKPTKSKATSVGTKKMTAAELAAALEDEDF